MDFPAFLLGDVRDAVARPWCEVLLAVTSLACGSLIGLEREWRGKAAGLRTMTLICFGSTLFTLVSMAPVFGRGDPGRVAAQIVTGVGFLGAGAIIRDRGSVVGLTTAAMIWLCAAVGMVVGAGYAGAGVAVAVAAPVALAIEARVETLIAPARSPARPARQDQTP